MNYLTFTQPENPPYPVVLLVPVLRKEEIQKAYLTPFGIDESEVLALDLHYSQTKKKTPKAELKRYVEEMLVPALTEAGAEYILCADSEYFKLLTGAIKVDANLGYVMDCVFGSWKVIYVPNYRQIFYDPEKVQKKIAQGMNALKDHRVGFYKKPGEGIIHFADYVYDMDAIADWLEKLLLADRPLSCDIEAFSLKHHTAGIGTITFCWNKHEGISFPVDLSDDPAWVRMLLRDFFERFTNKLIYHNISYDVYVLVYQLFMRDILDTEGLLHGLDVLLRNWDDTKLITYLATNSCAGNKLSLKDQAQEYAGNYAESDIKDIRKIPLDRLLTYNLVDGLSTWYVYEKHWDTMVADQQLDIYETLFKPAIVDIIQMQLTGMPLNMKRVHEVRDILVRDQANAVGSLVKSPIIQRFIYQLEEAHVAQRNATLKKKQIAMGDEPQQFNPNSDLQLRKLLFEMLALPVISYTDTKQPSADGDTLKALRSHTEDPQIIQMLNALIDYAAVTTVLQTFIPSMLNAAQGPDGWHYLFGYFNLGGTLSGRLSSSDPNLQNIPTGAEGEKTMKGRIGKLIKSCFEAPPGWIFAGLDFASLEDRISALTTKDPNKLKVYTDGYDGHSLRAFSYFRESMPDIVDTVESINSIQDRYKPERQDSKAPTFALTYQGTWITLVTNCGFSEAKAKMIEARYHELYIVSDQWIEARLKEAANVGYATVAFGLRVRTPLLHQVIRGNSKTPYEAEAEGRSVGNAMGQSYCLLNTRAGSEFMGKVRTSEHKLNIRPCAQIHDASYYLIKDDLKAVQFTNEHLVKAVEWQEAPEIAHDEVKLGGELSIFHPNWAKEVGIPNGASDEVVIEIIDKHLHKLAA